MLTALSILCIVLFGAYLIPVWRARGRQGLAALGPAMLSGAWLTALESIMALYPELPKTHASLLLLARPCLRQPGCCSASTTPWVSAGTRSGA